MRKKHGPTNLLNRLFGLAILFATLCTLFLTVFVPIEIYKLKQAQSWPTAEIVILESEIQMSQIPGRNNSPFLLIKIKDLDSGEESNKVRVRYGDFSLSLSGFNQTISTLENDLKKYPKGKTVTAFRSPDSNRYLLEQNTPDLMYAILTSSIFFLLFIFFHARKK